MATYITIDHNLAVEDILFTQWFLSPVTMAMFFLDPSLVLVQEIPNLLRDGGIHRQHHAA